MSIRLHKFLTTLLILLGAVAGAWLCALAIVLLRVYNPLNFNARFSAIPVPYNYLIPFALGGYFGARILSRIFGALIPAKCPHCGISTRTYSEGFGAARPLLNYTCANCASNPEPQTSE